jgi:NAD-dependent DNA ligase
MNINELRQKITDANQAYRTGNAIITDAEYDNLVDMLHAMTNGDDELLEKIGFEPTPDDTRKEPLPIPMQSMNKIKTAEELHKWAELKFITPETIMIITPKYDGLSFCAHEATHDAWTRGNGTEGQRSNEHYEKIMSSKKNVEPHPTAYSFGEVIMQKQVFATRWSDEFKNSRNMGAGALNRKEAADMLQDFDFLRYGLVEKSGEILDKSAQIDYCNKYLNQVPVPYKKMTLAMIDDTILQQTFGEFNADFETDGLIVEVDALTLRRQLGRETNGNPVYARAWKGFGAQMQISTVQGIDYQVSKYGLLKPVARIAPVQLDGVTVSNVTLNNARFVQDLGLGIGAQVQVIRSGQVIPKIVGVVQAAAVDLPQICPSCSEKVAFNDNNIELVCANTLGCKAQKLQKIIAFFTILEVENFAEGIVEQLYNNGYDSIAKILALTPADFIKLDSFKERKSEKIYQAIKEKMNNVPLEKLRHASSIFEGLGSKKLVLLNHYDQSDMVASLEEIKKIEGFSDTSAQVFVENDPLFWAFMQNLPITIAVAQEKTFLSQKLAAVAVCFSGFRDAELEQLVEKNGGRVVGTVSKNTTHLVMKEVGTGSSKEKNAQKLNVAVMQKFDFQAFVNDLL